MAALAPAYLPRRPTETVLYAIVRQNLESFLAHAREHYEGGLPRYVEAELRAYLKCGVFSEGFTRARCDTCGHDLLIAFSCKSRTACPRCAGRRMANTAATLVDRVLPDVPVRQFVLSLPHELRRLAAFKADVLSAFARLFVEAIFAHYRAAALKIGLPDTQGGAVTFVQRFGSLNLNVHFHVVALDGVFTRAPGATVQFHPAAAPTRNELDRLVDRVRTRTERWLGRHGFVDGGRALEERSNEPPAQTALDACATIALGRGNVATLARVTGSDEVADDAAHPLTPAHGAALAVDHGGFNVHAGVRIEAGDDVGRERLCRYGARPPLALDRLRRLPGGRVAYRLKYVGRGRGKHRVMTAMEFMARLPALIAPPRYPLVRYAGVLAPRSAWRRDVIPRAPEVRGLSHVGPRAAGAVPHHERARQPREKATAVGAFESSKDSDGRREAGRTSGARVSSTPAPIAGRAASTTPDDVEHLTANVIRVRHWDRLLGGALYAATARVDWARLLRRTFEVDVLACPRCRGRLRVLAVITDTEPVTRVLAHLGVATDAPPLARARSPSDDADDGPGQLELELE